MIWLLSGRGPSSVLIHNSSFDKRKAARGHQVRPSGYRELEFWLEVFLVTVTAESYAHFKIASLMRELTGGCPFPLPSDNATAGSSGDHGATRTMTTWKRGESRCPASHAFK